MRRREVQVRQTIVAVMLLAVTPVFAATHLNANQKKVGCSIVDGRVFCPSPGTGMCWLKGHNPSLGQPARAISIGNAMVGSHDPNEGHPERCG
jgi:hypothetical protein